VRNEMMELEEEGYIYQPHTSAGRIPTQAAYELLLAENTGEQKLDKKDQEY
jgi:heat-inducible transcriptional repressor